MMQRRLAAILAADVVGYSRLMGEDEAGTLAELQRHREEIINPKAAQHHGRVVKLMGDGTLMEFASVVDAVTFAVDLQIATRQRNSAIQEDRQIIFRIGINLGDIIHQDDDIHGDGVNVAARLETLSKPGGICISQSAYDQVRDKLDLSFDDQGEIDVKNIVRPVRVFDILINDKAEALSTSVVAIKSESSTSRKPYYSAALAIAIVLTVFVIWWQLRTPEFEPANQERMALELPEKPSIAVLPFDNLGAEKEQEYFADGMTDDLITDLSKLSGLFVISRNSTFIYKNKPTKIRDVAEDLGVRYVLEGSVRRVGDAVRINAQLIDAFSGYHVWAERYDGSLADIFKLQDKVIGQIVTALSVNLAQPDRSQTANAETTVPAAYDAFLQGRSHYRHRSPQEYVKAVEFFTKAIELDPKYSRAHAFLAKIYWFAIDTKWDVYLGIEYKAEKLARQHLAKALEMPTSEAFQVSADMLYARGQNEDALAEINRAIALEPNNPGSYLIKAWILTLSGRAEEAETNIRLSMRLDPGYEVSNLLGLGRALFYQHRHAEAAEVMERATKLAPDYEFAYRYLAAIYGHLGRIEEAKDAVAKYNELTGKTIGEQLKIANVEILYSSDWLGLDKIYLAHLLEGLRKAGVPEGAVIKSSSVDFEDLVIKNGGEFEVKGALKIDAAGAKTLFDRGVVFIDARGGGPYRRGHVPGAVNIHPSELYKEKLSGLVKPSEEVVFYCGGEDCPLAPKSCAKALVWGYTKVYYFAAGFPGWKFGGYQVEK